MKSRKRKKLANLWRCWSAVLGACAAVGGASAADTNAPAADTNAPTPLTPQQFFEGGEKSYDNWVDFSTGAFLTSGNRSQLQQDHQTSSGAFGGIEDFHYQTDIAKDTTLSLDGRAMFDDHDYKFKLSLDRDKLGYVHISYDQFRTWENGAGGFFPATGSFYPISSTALALDRGEFSVEAGLRLQNDSVPDVTFKYTHGFRNGDQGSTIWGGTHPDPALVGLQGLSPSLYSINEHTDAFQLDVTHHIKETEVGVGVHYETSKLDDALEIDQYPGEPVEQKITDRQGTSYDLLSVHAFTESWIKKNLMLSSGFSYSDMDSHLTGSRIYGSDFDVGYVQNASYGPGYYGLTGDSLLREYVTDLNLFYKPTSHLSITPSVRVDSQDINADIGGTETLGVSSSVPFTAYNDSSDLDVRERLDISYTGLTNWVLYARGDLDEGGGNLGMDGGLVPIIVGGTPVGVPPVQEQIDQDRFFQKYGVGARWYPLRAVTVDVGGYFKNDHYGYTENVDSTSNDSNSPTSYPGYLVMQGFRTYDGNGRLSLRPWQNVTLSSRYEFQLSTIQTVPDPASGLSGLESSQMRSHIIAQDVSWTPWSRLFLQGGINYVLSKTITPASDYTQAILNARNNYWMLNLAAGFVVDDKTDLNVAYYYYRANDYQDISLNGVSYGAGSEDQGVTTTLVRRLTANLRLTLKYGYFHDSDAPSGGNNNYLSQFIYSGLQYRF